MKIAVLVYGFPPEFVGGAELQTYEIVKRLAKRHKVLVLTRHLRGQKMVEKRQGFEIMRIRVVDIPVARYFSYILFGLISLLKLRKERPDLLHCVYISPNGVIGVIAKLFLKIPNITSIRGTFYQKGGVFKRISRFVLRHSDKILTQSRGQKDDVLKIYPFLNPSRIAVVPNGISLPGNLERATGSHLLFLGRLTDMKGIEYLIRAMRLIEASKRPKLVIAGHGPIEGKLRKMSLGLDVEFTGFVQPKKVREVMKKAGVFVLPSIYGEGFPTVLLEAMSMGLPIISTKLVGIENDIIVEGENGLLVEPYNPEQLAKAIREMSGNPGVRKRMSANNMKNVRKYEWKNIIVLLEKEHASLVSGCW